MPLVGQIAAGEPIPVPDDVASGAFAEQVAVSAALVPGRREGLFALRVRGHSMIDALIADGDIVILRQARTCENGETVAVWLKAERETTLKRFYHEGERVRLQPANATMQPLTATRPMWRSRARWSACCARWPDRQPAQVGEPARDRLSGCSGHPG